MGKITTDFIGTETLSVTKSRLEEILSFYGKDTSAYGDWGGVRSDINSLLVDSSVSPLENASSANVFLPKLNFLNNTDAVTADLYSQGQVGMDGDFHISRCFADEAGTIPAVLGGPIASVTPIAGQGRLIQPTSAARPTLAAMPATGIRNRANGEALGNFGNVSPFNGVLRTVVDQGTIDGERYVSVRYQGTPTATSNSMGYQQFESRAASASGQTWTASVRAQVIAGDPAGVNFLRFGVVEETAPTTFVAGNRPNTPVSTTETLITVSHTLTTGNQARLNTEIFFVVGVPVDVTIRYRGMQFEGGAVRTAYQANFSAFEITEAGVDTIHYALGSASGRWLYSNVTYSGVGRTSGSLIVGAEKLSDVAGFNVAAVSGGTNGSIGVWKPSNNAQWSARTWEAGAQVTATRLNVPAPDRALIHARIDRVADTVGLTYNGVPVTPVSAPLTGNMAGGTLVVGAQTVAGASPFADRIFSFTFRYPQMTLAEEARLLPILRSRTGVSL